MPSTISCKSPTGNRDHRRCLSIGYPAGQLIRGSAPFDCAFVATRAPCEGTLDRLTGRFLDIAERQDGRRDRDGDVGQEIGLGLRDVRIPGDVEVGQDVAQPVVDREVQEIERVARLS